ncbi:MAG: DUF1499 domain-containing protein [Desulfobulbaceae bacterium]|jgi:uncharacterized protein (DUF1499 family)|nr:DUF1499 domain-containing protein [Desulfobulbaceae bacterium]
MKRLTGRIVVMALGLLGLVGCAGERPNNLGAREGILALCPSSPNCVSSQTENERHRIAPLAFSSDPNAAFTRLKGVLSGRSDTTIVDDLPDYLRVELRTMLFVDDGEFLLDRTNKVIHVRSASRLGYSDLGKNRSRLEEIRRQFLALE